MRTDKITQKVQDALAEAQSLAQRHGQQGVALPHLLLALVQQEGGVVGPLLAKIGAAPKMVAERFTQMVAKLPRVEGGQTFLADDLAAAQREAGVQAERLRDDYISSEHLLLATVAGKSPSAALLAEMGVTSAAVLAALGEVRGSHRVTDDNPEGRYQALAKYTRDLTQAAQRGKTDPVIGRDDEIRRVLQVLGRRTKNNPVLIGEPGVGKTAIIEGLARRIVDGDVPSGMRNRRLLSLDLAALIAGAKYRGEFEDRLKALLKEVEERAEEVVLFIDELHTLVGAGASEGAMDASNMLKPALARGGLHCIGATTLSEYRRYIEKDAALERRFAPVIVQPPSVDDTIAILRGLKERYEIHHGVRIQDGALVAAATLSNRYITGRFLPDKAIDLVDEAASHLRLQIDSLPTEIDDLARRMTHLRVEKQSLIEESDAVSQARLQIIDAELGQLREEDTRLRSQWQKEVDDITAGRALTEEVDALRQEQARAEREGDLSRAAEIKYGRLPELARRLEAAAGQDDGARMLREVVTPHEIAAIVARWTGIPVVRMLQAEVAKLLEMEDRLAARVVGQREALVAVANAVRRSRAGLADPQRPVGSFLFMGPTGVGKTETARALAEFLFDQSQAMIRIDMSEYMEKHAVSRLVGAPPGYVGYEEGGQLTEAVRRRPYAVILLDEIEKAHPDVFNILLQVLDDGRLTDGQGRTVDFRHAVIIMTSNIGSDAIHQAAQDDPVSLQARCMAALRGHFRPEFLNRIDDVVTFRPLGEAQVADILRLQVGELESLLAQRGIRLEVAPSALNILASRGYDPALGARPLRRTLYHLLRDPLAQGLIAGRFVVGDVVRADAASEPDAIRLTKLAAIGAPAAGVAATAPESS